MQVHPPARASARKRTPAQPVLALALTGHRDCLRLTSQALPTLLRLVGGPLTLLRGHLKHDA